MWYSRCDILFKCWCCVTEVQQIQQKNAPCLLWRRVPQLVERVKTAGRLGDQKGRKMRGTRLLTRSACCGEGRVGCGSEGKWYVFCAELLSANHTSAAARQLCECNVAANQCNRGIMSSCEETVGRAGGLPGWKVARVIRRTSGCGEAGLELGEIFLLLSIRGKLSKDSRRVVTVRT
jgi:hypothetical protein